jgi:nucleoside-diphosphate-sugar epimerase
MVFVTGASGLIGSFICRELINKGFEIRALKRKTTDMSLLSGISEEINWVEGDLKNPTDLQQYLEGINRVVHCAAMVSYDSRDEDDMYRINVHGTANLLNASLQHGNIRRFLHVSSVAAIGKEKATHLSDEATKWQEEKTTAYARSKFYSELEAWRANAEGLPVSIINPSLVLGPGQWEKSSTQLFKYVWDENRFYTEGIANYVDVRDVAEIAVRLLRSEQSGERFIINAGSTDYKTLFTKIADHLGKKPPNVKARGNMIRLAILLGKLQSLITGKPPLITDEIEQVSKNRHVYANDKVKSALSYEFRELDETLAWSCELLKARTATEA